MRAWEKTGGPTALREELGLARRACPEAPGLDTVEALLDTALAREEFTRKQKSWARLLAPYRKP